MDCVQNVMSYSSRLPSLLNMEVKQTTQVRKFEVRFPLQLLFQKMQNRGERGKLSHFSDFGLWEFN